MDTSSKLPTGLDMADVRRWCIEAGMNGTDLETAMTSWMVSPNGADGIRVKRVIEIRNRNVR